MSHAVTVPTGRGVGALEAPQNKHGQEHRTGTSRAEQTTEAMAELGALEAMAVQGAQVAMAVLGALEAMAVQGAQEAMADGLRGLGLGPLGPAPTARTLLPPPKKFPGEVRGYQVPSGARHRQTGQDIPQEPLPPPRQGGRRLEWPPWPQQEEPAPDESPWTIHDKTRLKCSCGHNTT